MARILMWFSDHFRTEIDLRICHKNDWLIFDHSATSNFSRGLSVQERISISFPQSSLPYYQKLICSIQFLQGTCNYVECKYGQWSQWSTTCGKGERRRTMQTIGKTTQRENCNGLPQTCSSTPDVQTRTQKCKFYFEFARGPRALRGPYKIRECISKFSPASTPGLHALGTKA